MGIYGVRRATNSDSDFGCADSSRVCWYAGARFLVGGQAHRLIRDMPLVCLSTILNSVLASGTRFAQCRRQDRTHNENYHATRPHRYRIRFTSTFVSFVRGRRRGSRAAQANFCAGARDVLLCLAIRTGAVPERVGRRGAELPTRSPLNGVRWSKQSLHGSIGPALDSGMRHATR